MVNTSCPSCHSAAFPGRPGPWHRRQQCGGPQQAGLVWGSGVPAVPSSFGHPGMTDGQQHSGLAGRVQHFHSHLQISHKIN